MPKRNPRIIAHQNPPNCLRRSPRFLSQNKISVEISAREQTAPDSLSPPPCSGIAKTRKNVGRTLPNGGQKDAMSKTLVVGNRRKSARLDSRTPLRCLDLPTQSVVEKRVTRSSTGALKRVSYMDCEYGEISENGGREIISLQNSSKGAKRSARLDGRAHVKRLTRRISDSDWEESPKKRVRILSKDQKVGDDSCKKNIDKIEKGVSRWSLDERKHEGDDELSKLQINERDAKDCGVTMKSCDKNGKRTQGEKRDVDNGWTKEQEVSLRRAYFVAKPTPQFWKKVARMVPGKSAKECFDRIHSDQSTPSQPPSRSRPKTKELSPILFSPSKLLSPADTKRKKPVSRTRRTLAAQKTVRKLLQKQHTEDQEYEADLFSVLEPAPSPLNLQIGTPFASPALNQGSSSAQRKQRSRLSSSQKAAFVSPPVLKQIKNKALHEKYIDQLHTRDAKRKAAALRKAKKVDGNVSFLKPDLVKVAKDALLSDAQDAINRLRSLPSGKDYNSTDDDDSACVSSDKDEDVEF